LKKTEFPFIESVITERSKHNEYIPQHLQESSVVNVKGATLKGKVPLGAGLSYYQGNYLWWRKRCPK